MAQYILTTGDIDADHIDSREFYSSYGWSRECVDGPDMVLQCVEYEEAESGETAETIVRVMSRYPYTRHHEVSALVIAAERVYDAGRRLERALDRAIEARSQRDLDACLAALDEARTIGVAFGSTADSDQLRALLIAERVEDMDMAVARIDLSDVASAGGVAFAISAWAQGTDGTSACSGTAAAVVALAEGARVYIDTDDGRCCMQDASDASDEDALVDIGGSYYTISDWSEHSVVRLEVPSIDDALSHPEMALQMGRQAVRYHGACSDITGWRELLAELAELRGAATTLRGYGDTFVGDSAADAARAWIEEGIEDDGSIGSWCDIGCWDAPTARRWIAAGMSPDDVVAAAQIVEEGISEDVMAGRYHSGIVYACCSGEIPAALLIRAHRETT